MMVLSAAELTPTKRFTLELERLVKIGQLGSRRRFLSFLSFLKNKVNFFSFDVKKASSHLELSSEDRRQKNGW